MKTPEDRSYLFVEEIIGLAEKEFEGSRFDCDRRRGSFQSSVAVNEVRVYDNLAPHAHRFTPIAIINIVDPEKNAHFQLKTRQVGVETGEMREKAYSAADLKKGLVEQLKLAQTGKEDSAWLFLEAIHINGAPARRKVAEAA